MLFANTTMPKEWREVKYNQGNRMEKNYGVNEALCTAGVLLLFSVAQIFVGS